MSKLPLVQRLREEPNFMFWLDIAEAADRIDELEAEVKRLREALERAFIFEKLSCILATSASSSAMRGFTFSFVSSRVDRFTSTITPPPSCCATNPNTVGRIDAYQSRVPIMRTIGNRVLVLHKASLSIFGRLM